MNNKILSSLTPFEVCGSGSLLFCKKYFRYYFANKYFYRIFVDINHLKKIPK